MNIIYCHHACRMRDKFEQTIDDITKLGEKDAKIYSKMLSNSVDTKNVSSIYSSPFNRCNKTAKILQKKFNVPIKFDERLNELKKEEAWVDCQARLEECLLDIVKQHNDDETIIVVTSGVNIVAFINLAYGIMPNKNAPFLKVLSCSPIEFHYNKNEILNKN